MNLQRTTIIDRTDMVNRCIVACRDCHSTCTETVYYCLEKGGAHAGARHISLMEDCADLCELSEEAMLRASDYMNQVCSLCADICEACAESCDKFGDDKVMMACAENCRSCADNCREMVTGGELHSRLTSFS